MQGAGFSNSVIGFLTALLYFAAISPMILWARSSDRRDERTWHVATAALMGAAALFAASAVHNSVLLLIALAVSGAGMYASLAPFYGVATSFLSGPAMAAGIALINMIGGLLGGFAGQYVIGIIRERTGAYAVALPVIAASLLISACIVITLGRSMASLKNSVEAVEG